MLVHEIMSRPPLSVTIIAKNEEKNLPRAIRSVLWADEILVVDSGSTDHTIEIAKQLGANVIQQPWLGYGQQKNFAQDHAQYDWVLNLDADEEVSPELQKEMLNTLEKIGSAAIQEKGFFFARKTFFLGRWIRHGGWYPNYLVRMADRKVAHWTEPEVHEELCVQGQLMRLKHPLHHYTFSSIQEQVITNLRYSRQGFREMQKRGQKFNGVLLLLRPLGKFLETFFLKLGFLDGLPGFIISVNAAHSMFLRYAYWIEGNRNDEDPHHRQ